MNANALLATLSRLPVWCYWLLALMALCLGCELHGRHAVQVKWDAAAAIENSLAKEKLAVATNRANAAELSMKSKIKEVNDDRNKKIAAINDRLSAALYELRARPARRGNADSEGAGTTGQCAGASGAELSRPDAGFLEGEAARADQYVIELNGCHKEYDAVADGVNNLRSTSGSNSDPEQ
ncbi:hypothetical protein ACXX82_24135 [Glaciimonas sp. GNP009]